MKFGLLIGLTWVALGAFVMVGPVWMGGKVDFNFKYLWMCGMGILAIAECWRRLRNREARPEPPGPDPIGRDLDA